MSTGIKFPFPQDVLNREYGRLMKKYRGKMHHVNWWRANNARIASKATKQQISNFLQDIWREHPDEYDALKARVRLLGEDA